MLRSPLRLRAGRHVRKGDSVTSHHQHMGSEPAHPVSQRPLGPYRVAPIGYGAMRLTGPGVRAATGPQRCGPAAPASRRGRSRPHRHSRVLRPPRGQRAHPAIAPPVPDRARPGKQGRRPSRRPRRHLRLRRTRAAPPRIEENLLTLDVDSVHVVNLRLMRGSRPDSLFDDQLAAMTAARDNGLIGAVGLSTSPCRTCSTR